MQSIPLSAYADAIALHQPLKQPGTALSSGEEYQLLSRLLDSLSAVLHRLGVDDYRHYDSKQQRELLDAALTILPPDSLSQDAVTLLDKLLQSEQQYLTITDVNDLMEQSFLTIGNSKIVLWRGDITTLRADAIINAANSQMLGCFQPGHHCIDNAIHKRAGVQLRQDCHTIMQLQGHDEPTGSAKITRAYNLPSDYVIHTVGPIVQSEVTEKQRQQLISCYQQSLSTSEQVTAIRSMALCAISTGVFSYPIEQATRVAVQTVIDWLRAHPGRLDCVVFNVFTQRDHFVYQSVLEEFACEL
jgi:O-acetyl-ADP-ribose deacetylase (regulator of RNase III)